MNFSEDRGKGIIYLPTKFQLHRFIDNKDLLADRNHWKCTHTQTESDTQPIKDIGYSNKGYRVEQKF